ncbi:benzoate/H(+) symporter BenE family transporter [Paenibacillus barcinonensis]|uniref:Benzoate membrane transport protein n=1 Tax=Paenibacillus barcinonensis TaxID=198119 RepID=A0A2V4V6L1_PAEBA|nr:benzoate/H(+) symporter BenE family transporter [Paenibacillus barcinonensis]PYE47963.1 benzoate membrane transport protein [Paenibacillus barcinonensis]QKS55085.1 benzoate/H(+) symporter BenE family transporter [Paenibacillus barcinonensis]
MKISSNTIRGRDWVSPVIAALISVIVNYGGTFILVFQAAKAAGLSPEMTASWIWSISIGVGITGIWLSFRYKEPIITAWSTPGVAFLVSVLAVTPYSEAIGAYMISAVGFIILGLSGMFERFVRLIPPGIASGLLAGILLQFGISAFAGAKVEPLLVILLFTAYVVLKRFIPRYAIVGILMIGILYLVVAGKTNFSSVQLAFASPVLVMPEFSVQALLGVAVPLFIITLTGQYMPGMLVLRNDGFKTSANPILTVTGLGSLIAAPFGSHAFNVAAITAAICTGKDAHEDASKRYIAGIACGVFYIIVGIFGVTLAALFLVLPAAFIATLAGLALLGTIGGSLANALADPKGRETALITFLATAANVTLLGVGGAFWGLVAGVLAHVLLHSSLFKKRLQPNA